MLGRIEGIERISASYRLCCDPLSLRHLLKHPEGMSNCLGARGHRDPKEQRPK